MIRSHFGLDQHPFSLDKITLLPHQSSVLETLRVHCQQGGLCVVVGEPGTGKSVVKHALVQHDPKRLITPVVNSGFLASRRAAKRRSGNMPFILPPA